MAPPLRRRGRGRRADAPGRTGPPRAGIALCCPYAFMVRTPVARMAICTENAPWHPATSARLIVILPQRQLFDHGEELSRILRSAQSVGPPDDSSGIIVTDQSFPWWNFQRASGPAARIWPGIVFQRASAAGTTFAVCSGMPDGGLSDFYAQIVDVKIALKCVDETAGRPTMQLLLRPETPARLASSGYPGRPGS